MKTLKELLSQKTKVENTPFFIVNGIKYNIFGFKPIRKNYTKSGQKFSITSGEV